MPQSIEYLKQFMEIVFINLPGPKEPDPGMTGGDLLHGFLADLHEVTCCGHDACSGIRLPLIRERHR